MLGHQVLLEAHVWAREELRVTGWSRAQASSPAALMAGSGGWLGRAREKGEGDFYRPGSMPRWLLGSVVAYRG
jgi:hypothetical protein